MEQVQQELDMVSIKLRTISPSTSFMESRVSFLLLSLSRVRQVCIYAFCKRLVMIMFRRQPHALQLNLYDWACFFMNTSQAVVDVPLNYMGKYCT